MTIRRLRFWKWASNYFPITVVKTTDLPANGQNYMAVCHPHGIFALSIGLTFGTEASDISSRLVPGLRCHVFTLWTIYIIPLIRELFTVLGGQSTNEVVMTELLSNSKNTLATLVVGGARDAMVERSDKFCTVVRRRLGFCRIALKTGTHLVPVISFGEDQAYTTDSPIRRIVVRLMEYSEFFVTALIQGRWWTLVPHRVPITIVIGAPVRVSQTDNPTRQDIQDVNDRYCEALTKLYDDHKMKYGYGNKPLVLL